MSYSCWNTRILYSVLVCHNRIYSIVHVLLFFILVLGPVSVQKISSQTPSQPSAAASPLAALVLLLQ